MSIIKLSRALCCTPIVLALGLLTLILAARPAASAPLPAAPIVADDVPQPLPRDCTGVNPPHTPACCAFGYVYYDGVPVSGANVHIQSRNGVFDTTTASGWASDGPYYQVDLSSAPLLVSAGDVITITASYNDMVSARTWTVQSDGQHVDLGLVAGYQAEGPISPAVWQSRIAVGGDGDLDALVGNAEYPGQANKVWLNSGTVPLTDVIVTGPTAGVVNTAHTFTATASPVTGTIPITDIWQATGQAPVPHTSSLSHTDTVTFTWSVTGTQAITVTATTNVLIATIIVPDDYPTIQQAVDAASPGDTVYVRAGTYNENVTIGKTLTLQGEDRATTIMDGSGSGTVLYITADGAVISGFTIRDGSPHGIHLYQADNCQIDDVLVTSNSDMGIFLQASTYNTVANSNIADNQWGINMGDQGSHHNTIQNVEAHSNTPYDGFVGYAGSHYTNILDSRFYNNNTGITIGWSQDWRVENTEIYSNTSYGIHIDTASNGTVKDCEIYSNGRGVLFAGLGSQYNTIVGSRIYSNNRGLFFDDTARNNTAKENEIYDNDWGVYVAKERAIYANYANTFYHNSFIDNTVNALVLQDDYANTWDNGYPSGGNYWDDFTGDDLYSGPAQDRHGSDGIGDTAYVVSSTTNIDQYPLAVRIFTTNDSPTEPGNTTTLEATVMVGGDFAYTWAFGDGDIGSGAVVTHIYPAAGVYTAIVTASKAIRVFTATTIVTIADYTAPTAAFTASPLSGTVPLDVQFTDQSTGDIISWDWTFGNDGISGARHPGHTYEFTGTYTVTLAIAGPGGSDAEVKTDYITVSPIISPTWTFLLYLDGDNNLHSRLEHTLDGLQDASANPHVAILIQFDGRGYHDTWRYRIQPGEDHSWYMGELDMDDPQTLSDFIVWAREKYPADHTYLAVADHGRGTTGIAWDDTSGDDHFITVAELGTALQSATADGAEPLDVVHYDACLMAMIENAYQIKDYADYFVASQNLGWSVFAYDRYATQVTAATTPEELATAVVNGYHNALTEYPHTISALDLGQAVTVTDKVSALATALLADLDAYKDPVSNTLTITQRFDSRDYYVINKDDEYLDLYDFAQLLKQNVPDSSVKNAAQGVMEAVTAFVVAEWHESGYYRDHPYWDLEDAHGVSVYFPPEPGGWDWDDYMSHVFHFTEDGEWDEFLQAYLGLIVTPPPTDPGLPPVLDLSYSVFLPIVVK